VFTSSKLFAACPVVLALAITGCGASVSSNNGNNGGGSAPQFTPVGIQGQYEVEAISAANPGSVSLIEVNFNQTDTSVSASKGNVVVIGGTQNTSTGVITLQTVGGECDNHALGQDTVQGTFSAAAQANITLTEYNSGTATANVTFSSDGSKITSGSYSVPAQCTDPADSGTVIGVRVPQFSGSYAGMLTSSSLGTNAFIVTVSQSGVSMNVRGTMSGTPFIMSGSVVGAIFDVAGTISGQSMEALGLYDIVNNDFVIYDNQGNYLGQLNAGTNPQAAMKSTVRLKAPQFLRIDQLDY
jgi:hypothetical protein